MTDVVLHRLIGWWTATHSEGDVVLQVEALSPPPHDEPVALSILMRRQTARELATELRRLAEPPHVEPPAKPS